MLPMKRGEAAARTSAAIHAAAAVAILALGAAAYANALGAGFAFDDLPSIVKNPAAHDWRNFVLSRTGYAQRPNRYVAYLTFALNCAWGGLDPAGYHAVNVAIHLASALLVYALVVLLFRTPRARGSALAAQAPALGFLAGALFAVHPLQTQAVTYVVQRLASLATLFGLATVVGYLRWRLRGEAAQPPRGGRGWGYAAALGAAVLAMRTKEIAFTVPLLLAAVELWFLDGPRLRRALYVAPFLATMAIVPATVVRIGEPLGVALADASTVTRVQTGLSRLEYFRAELTVIARYLGLLLLPVGQNVDPDVPVPDSWLAPSVVGAGALLAALGLAVAVCLWRTSTRAARPLDPALRVAAFGGLWFFVTLSVESTFIPIVDLMYEHRVYLPSAGFALVAAVAAGLVARRLAPRRPAAVVVGAALALAAALVPATYLRNEVWASELALWSDAARKSPHKARPLNNLGAALTDAGRLDEAAATLGEVIRAHPEHAEAYYNLGRIRLATGDFAQAGALFRKALALREGYAEAYANLGAALIRQQRFQEAVATLEEARPVIEENAEARFNLGVAYATLGDVPAATRELAALATRAPALAADLQRYLAQLGAPVR